MTQKKITLALLLGDPAGIGPELVSKLLAKNITDRVNLVIIGEKNIFDSGNKITKLNH
jgi:4-hydroxythreonine-4-phosphate dehydrogenase